jgi:hypothetical protein
MKILWSVIRFVIMILFVLFIGIVIILANVIQVPSFTPEDAILKHVLFTMNPIEAFQLKIHPTKIDNKVRGRQFIVEGFRDNVTRMEVRFFYLKESGQGWYVTSTGIVP